MVVLALLFWTRTKAARNGAPSAPLITPEMVPAEAAPAVAMSSVTKATMRSFFMVSSAADRLFFTSMNPKQMRHKGACRGGPCGRPLWTDCGRPRGAPLQTAAEQTKIFPRHGGARERRDLGCVVGRSDLDHVHSGKAQPMQPPQDRLRLPARK